ncbi:SAM-dependent methyltransferase [Nonomuraea sp. NPDC049400]|uniref:SAM-dependent methyltransferase n=1 Tax=Nonomuraea sp. NPDC049400 TaxID=3364352 RepID=UPI00379A4246
MSSFWLPPRRRSCQLRSSARASVMESDMTSVSGIDATLPGIARVYDYWLGGKDNFEVDREEAERLAKINPKLPDIACSNRRWIIRVVRYAVRSGVRQILDVGCGLPTSSVQFPNVHETAQEEAVDTRVVYVDNDPMVQTHGRALLATNECTSLQVGDLRDLNAFLESMRSWGLDLSQPVLLLLAAVLHFFPDRGEPHPKRIVGEIMGRLPPGSFLAISHGEDTGDLREVAKNYTAASTQLRNQQQVLELFSGLELVGPGVVQLHKWHPDEDRTSLNYSVPVLGGLARKPSCHA